MAPLSPRYHRIYTTSGDTTVRAWGQGWKTYGLAHIERFEPDLSTELDRLRDERDSRRIVKDFAENFR